ncbi:hypothetical protein Q0F99_06215 [Rathayibacter oskolensis]|nr:hypothetical protein [Rathayibacter oskolensis]WKK72534.1 hypothetical protein Q0F99_06215 [Rathayibacter oskolensis]
MRTALAVATVAATALLGATVPSSAFGATEKPLLHYTFDTAPTGTTVADTSGNGYDATVRRTGATFADGKISLPGGSASAAPYLDIPTAGLVGKKDLTFSTWLSPRSGPGNVAAAFVGAPVASGASNSSGYWLLNPSNPSGYVKSVVTNSVNAGAPWGTEVGPGATNAGTTGARTPRASRSTRPSSTARQEPCRCTSTAPGSARMRSRAMSPRSARPSSPTSRAPPTTTPAGAVMWTTSRSTAARSAPMP